MIFKTETISDLNVSGIYKITLLIDGRVYIGQTTNIRKRMSSYRHAEMSNLNHPIYLAIKEYGSDSFEFSILKICDENELTMYENYFIMKYNATDPIYGFNLLYNNGTNNTVRSRLMKSLSHKGLVESSVTKRKKSNTILAIIGNTLIVSDSAKLFGDYVGKSKDYIKNCLRQPSRVQGYRLYYDDYDKRQEIRNKMLNKRSIRDYEYINILNLLDEIEFEGVETIYSLFDVYTLSYDNVKDDEPQLVQYCG